MSNSKVPAKLILNRIKHIASKINGVSLDGISWDPSNPSEIDVARNFVDFMADRRIAHIRFELEIHQHVNTSVLRTRDYITEELRKVSRNSEIAKYMREIQRACRNFLTREQDRRDWEHDYSSLMQLRTTFFINLARIIVAYDIEVDGELADAMSTVDLNNPEESAILAVLLREPLLQAKSISK